MLTPGSTIADRYRLQRLIATGGMGQVWEAYDQRLGRPVAVKVLKAEFSDDPTFQERFRAEARTTANLNHPGIASVYDYGQNTDPAGQTTTYLVMELVQGEPLNAVLARMGRLPLNHTLDMLEQTGRALAHAHAAGVVHRDVKPGNILVTPTGQVKITDFGIAKAVDASPVTKTGMVMGTAQYIAPEQAIGQDASSASDVYSLGVVGYEALAGQRPFASDNAVTVAMQHVRDEPPPLPPDVPQPVRDLIARTLTKDPARRYRNGAEFADAVAAVRAGGHPPIPAGAAAGVPTQAVQSPTAVIAPPTIGTRAMTAPQPRVPVPPSAPQTRYAALVPPRQGMTSGQRFLAWLAAVVLVVALGFAAFAIIRTALDNQRNKVPSTTVQTTEEYTEEPTTEESTEETSTTTSAPVTTTAESSTTTTEESTTTTQTETPTSSNGSLQFPGQQ